MTSSVRRSAHKALVATAAPTPEAQPEWDLRLYVLGESQPSVAAIGNLRKLCEAHLSGRYRIERSICCKNHGWRVTTRSWRSRPWCENFRRRSEESSAICPIRRARWSGLTSDQRHPPD